MEKGLIVHNSMVKAFKVVNGTRLPKEFIFRLISSGNMAIMDVASLESEVALLEAEVALLGVEVAALATYISNNIVDGV